MIEDVDKKLDTVDSILTKTERILKKHWWMIILIIVVVLGYLKYDGYFGGKVDEAGTAVEDSSALQPQQSGTSNNEATNIPASDNSTGTVPDSTSN